MKKISVNVGISAHNEENTIIPLLKCLVRQQGGNFKLHHIFVVADGCIDQTVSVVKKFAKNHKRIKLYNDGKHLGKMARLNQMYKKSQSDVFISFDADTFLDSLTVVERMVKPFHSQLVGLVGAFCLPDKPVTVIGRIVYAGIKIWEHIRIRINHGKTIHNHHAQASALHKSLYKHHLLPRDIMADDDFWYFMAVKKHKIFAFANKAKVYYQAPQTLHDFFWQTTRYINAKHHIKEYFGSWVYAYYKVPVKDKVIGTILAFLDDPFWMPIASIFQVAVRLFKSKFAEDSDHLWKPIHSTKIALGSHL